MTRPAGVQSHSTRLALYTGPQGWTRAWYHQAPNRPVWLCRQTIIHGQAQEGKPERGQRSATPSASLAAATPAASTEAGNNHPPQQAPDSARAIAYAAAPGIIRVGVKDEGPSTQDAVMADLAAAPAADAAAAPAAAEAADPAAASGGV